MAIQNARNPHGTRVGQVSEQVTGDRTEPRTRMGQGRDRYGTGLGTGGSGGVVPPPYRGGTIPNTPDLGGTGVGQLRRAAQGRASIEGAEDVADLLDELEVRASEGSRRSQREEGPGPLALNCTRPSALSAMAMQRVGDTCPTARRRPHDLR